MFFSWSHINWYMDMTCPGEKLILTLPWDQIIIIPLFIHSPTHTIHSILQTSHQSPGGREVRMTGRRRESNPRPADRRKGDRLPRPIGHPAPTWDQISNLLYEVIKHVMQYALTRGNMIVLTCSLHPQGKKLYAKNYACKNGHFCLMSPAISAINLRSNLVVNATWYRHKLPNGFLGFTLASFQDIANFLWKSPVLEKCNLLTFGDPNFDLTEKQLRHFL